jgi:integration host factor subunit beta
MMTKGKLIEKLAEAEGIALKTAELAVNVAFESMARTLAEDGRIEIRGFGSFHVKDYEEYTGRNPKSGERFNVAPKKLPVFRVGKELKGRVDGKWRGGE